MMNQLSATRVLVGRFGEVLRDEEYVPGKTLLRDALLASDASLSQLEAETMCETLEAVGVIRFMQASRGGPGWTIDARALEGGGAQR